MSEIASVRAVADAPSLPTLGNNASGSSEEEIIAANAGDDTPGADTDAVKENKSMKGSVSVRRPVAPNLDANEKIRRHRRFLALPLEVLLEIFTELTPLDLANLAQMARRLREILTTNVYAASTWKAVRERNGVPDCHPLPISEITWTRFLYSHKGCRVCGKLWSDYTLMLRVCNTRRCQEKTFVWKDSVMSTYPDISDGVLQLLANASDQCNQEFYDRAECLEVVEKYTELKQNVRLQKPGAVDAFEKFKSDRIDYVKALRRLSLKCRFWVKDYQEGVVRPARKTRIDRNLAQYRLRLQEIGHDDRDAEFIAFTREFKHIGEWEVTDEVWEKVMHAFQMYADGARCKRLDSEQAPIIGARKALIDDAFRAYKAMLGPTKWASLPPSEYLYATREFRTMLYSDLDTHLTQDACDEIARQLPRFITTFNNNIASRLLSCEVSSGTRNPDQIKHPQRRARERLALVTSVFRWEEGTGDTTWIFGMNDVVARLAHHKAVALYEKTYHPGFWIALSEKRKWNVLNHDLRFAYDLRACEVCAALVDQLGLDPETAWPEELDRLDRRFVCSCCVDNTGGRDMYPRDIAYTWREAIAHAMRQWRGYSVEVEFRVLQGQEEEFVRRAEEAATGKEPSLWSCALCCKHIDDPQTRSKVVAHLIATHDTPAPKEGIDFVLVCPGVHQIPRDDKVQQSLSRVLKSAGVSDNPIGGHDSCEPLPPTVTSRARGGWRLQW